jgi:hypothetical protein
MLTIDHITELGYDVQEVGPRIYLVSNFAAADELSILFDEVTSAAEEDWSHGYLSEVKKHSLAKFGRDDIENLVEEGLLEITGHFADKTLRIKDEELRFTLHNRAAAIFEKAGDLEFTGFMNHQRLYPGSYLTAHFDQYSDKLVQYAGVLYINDDYVEGEVFFPEHDLQLRPAPGSLLIFPGTKDYVHGVHTVGEGPVRYILPAFIKARHPDGSMAGWGDFG